MSPISITTAAAVAGLVALLSPANAAYQHQSVSVYPDLPVSASASHVDASAPVTRNAAIALTSRHPWRAPVGHFQPRRDDVPRVEEVSRWEHQQQQLDQELDHKLVICRGC
jgi:hypothetical protein